MYIEISRKDLLDNICKIDSCMRNADDDVELEWIKKDYILLLLKLEEIGRIVFYSLGDYGFTEIIDLNDFIDIRYLYKEINCEKYNIKFKNGFKMSKNTYEEIIRESKEIILKFLLKE